MALSGTISRIASVAGVSIQSSVTRTATGGLPLEVTLPVAKAGSLTTRTDEDTGVVTAASHGILDGAKVNVFWADGSRYGMDASSNTTNTLALDNGAGDNFPTANTAVTMSEQVVINCADFDGDNMEMFVVACDRRAHIQFHDTGAVEVAAKDLTAGEDWSWAADTGITNPLTGNATTGAKASCGDASIAGTLKIGILYNA